MRDGREEEGGAHKWRIVQLSVGNYACWTVGRSHGLPHGVVWLKRSVKGLPVVSDKLAIVGGRGGVRQLCDLLNCKLVASPHAGSSKFAATSELESVAALMRPRERRAPLMTTLPPDLNQ